MTEVRRFCKGESGQMLAMVAVMMIALLCVAGLVIDMGRLYFSYKELQASCDAAAMAGAQSRPNSTAITTATSYSSVPGGKNVFANVPNVTMATGYPMVKCLTTLTAQGIPCSAPANGNAIVVRQQVTVPMYFAKFFGKSTMTVSATATASMRSSPYNVAIVLDTTGSMNNYDNDSNCLSTRLSCAASGVRTLLGSLTPCASTCGTVTNGNVTNGVDSVSLYTFPGVSSTAQAANDYNCSGNNPAIAPYSYPTLPVYQIVPFSTDYRTSNSGTSLNLASNLVAAVGGNSTCTGMQAIGGEGTYYAGVIYKAQADLANARAANPGSVNVMVILSDGDASANASAMPGASTTSGVYPSTKNQCHQAVTAAQAAAGAGTNVYTVAYGATSSGCSTDSPAISPCQTMQQMASNSNNFYSDYTATGGSSSCVSSAQGTTNLNQIFSQIAGSLTDARLIPDNLP